MKTQGMQPDKEPSVGENDFRVQILFINVHKMQKDDMNTEICRDC